MVKGPVLRDCATAVHLYRRVSASRGLARPTHEKFGPNKTLLPLEVDGQPSSFLSPSLVLAKKLRTILPTTTRSPDQQLNERRDTMLRLFHDKI